MVNPSEKNKFKSVLENICGKLNFPMSSLSDDLFIYEDTFDEALELNVNKEDEPCDNQSDTIPGEKCSGITGDEETAGTIMRTWGRGRRRVKCDVCNGTGVKPKNNYEIKYVKFWFNADGKYILTTGTDGKERPQSSGYEGGTLDDDIDNYVVVKTGISHSELRGYRTGDYFKFSASSSPTKTGVAMLFIDGGRCHMIQNFVSGSAPNYSNEWRKAAKYSWVVTSSGDLRGTLTLLKYKDEVEGEEKQTDWYAFNGLIDLGNSKL
jgi:hypothetical protein